MSMAVACRAVYQVHPVIDQEPVGKPFQGEFAGGILARNRVSVSVDFNAELAVHAGRLNDGRFISQGMERFELFLGKELPWDLLCLPVDPDIGNRIKPVSGRRIDDFKIGKFQAVKKVLFHIAHAVFHAPFFMRPGFETRNDWRNPGSGD